MKRLSKTKATLLCVMLVITAVFVLSACVLKKSYTVHFNTDGGSVIADAESDKKTGKVARPNDPTKGGFTFDDWYTEAAGGTVFDFDTVISAETTLYARYTPVDNGPDRLANGNYLIPVSAWHELNDAASMMSALLYGDAFVKVGDTEIEITVYFVSATIMGQFVSPQSISNFRYDKNGGYVAATSSEYDVWTDVNTVRITVDEISEYILFKMANGAMGGADSTIRLKFTAENAVLAAEPEFEVQQGTYTLPVTAVKIADETTSSLNNYIHSSAYVEVKENSVEITIYIKPTGAYALATLITDDVKYDVNGSYAGAVENFDLTTGVSAYTMTVELAEFVKIQMHVVPMPAQYATQEARLRFDLAGAAAASEQPTFARKTGAYLVPVAARHATNDAASSLQQYMYTQAYVEIKESTVEITIYIQPAGSYASASQITDKVQYLIGSEYIDATLTQDSPAANYASAKMTVDLAEYIGIKINVLPMPEAYRLQSARLKFTFAGAAIAIAPPDFGA
ncbi:MAG: NEAT domain-containing protein [Clostridiales bacterium]|jgi:hypothetical protein|nr:NEAT domain-containing protein [Clostridiales bacterium]